MVAALALCFGLDLASALRMAMRYPSEWEFWVPPGLVALAFGIGAMRAFAGFALRMMGLPPQPLYQARAAAKLAVGGGALLWLGNNGYGLAYLKGQMAVGDPLGVAGVFKELRSYSSCRSSMMCRTGRLHERPPHFTS